MTEIEQLRQDIATLEAAKKDMDRISAAYYPPGYWRQIDEHAITTELKERLAKLEAEENRKGSKMKWTYSGEGEWSMPSAYHDDGLSFQWRIGVCEDGTFCVSGSDPELTRCRETLPTLAEAKIFCESIEQQIREPGSRCNLELPLDAAAARARIAELEAELSRRPVVWCAKFKSGEMVKQTSRTASRCYREHTALYRSQSLAKGIHPDLQIEPYTGEQS